MPEPRDDEFYVGYLPQAPPAIASHVRVAVALILVLAAGLGLLLVNAQKRFAPAVYEFGASTEFTGWVRERPYPMLLVRRPGRPGGEPAFSTYFLTVFGKRGAEARVAGLDGRAVTLRGALIYRDGKTMIDVEDGSVAPLDVAAAERLKAAMPAAEEDLGVHTFVGEIVDSKCFLGVMKPGNLKAHRSCAARCISGGIPPVLVVRDAEGMATYLLLVSEDGEAVNRQVLELVAQPVEITGRVVRLGDQLMLEADPDGYRLTDG